ncbi:hypothetical protein [Psychroserpens damuponensis]|uniref:hypothetical protein n=1 Tax=Psychroserpens damuponensis TaxID=943936 RepID=UPI000B2E1AA8|nr:hypothetical protein [Psychroserpens damuponensis]
MKHISLLLIAVLLFSCGNERTLQLPEIQNANITEIQDVSHAYVFYDETKEDSVELNRKNLISTTNWLINVDKRLTLAQAIPKIKFLQEKKRNAKMHKNEAAKNYFTCHDTSISNLGFLEFTDVNYITNIDLYENDLPIKKIEGHVIISFFEGYFSIDGLYKSKETNQEILQTSFLKDELRKLQNENRHLSIDLMFISRLSFQNYITFKSELKKIESETISINKDEFLF